MYTFSHLKGVHKGMEAAMRECRERDREFSHIGFWEELREEVRQDRIARAQRNREKAITS